VSVREVACYRDVVERNERLIRAVATLDGKDSGETCKDLKRRGFSFVGPTVTYAFMQAVGMVNDHLVDCFRYREIARGIADAT
jgi:3-methyladenine DNA glycosylase Tag